MMLGVGKRKNADRPLEDCRGWLGAALLYHAVIGRCLAKFLDRPSWTTEPTEIYLYDSQNVGSKMQLSGRYYNQDLFLMQNL